MDYVEAKRSQVCHLKALVCQILEEDTIQTKDIHRGKIESKEKVNLDGQFEKWNELSGKSNPSIENQIWIGSYGSNSWTYWLIWLTKLDFGFLFRHWYCQKVIYCHLVNSVEWERLDHEELWFLYQENGMKRSRKWLYNSDA